MQGSVYAQAVCCGMSAVACGMWQRQGCVYERGDEGERMLGVKGY